jgi:hypothetical protein
MPYDDDEQLEGEYLRAICMALSRNAVGGLKNAAVVLHPDEEVELPKRPKRTSTCSQERKPRNAAARSRLQLDRTR